MIRFLFVLTFLGSFHVFAEERLYFNVISGSVPELRTKLKTGSPLEKDQVLDNFMVFNQPELIPDVIDAILDDTRSAKYQDTGWGTIYHHAATALCKFAKKNGDLTDKDCTSSEYSFYSSVGTADLESRKKVREHWLGWWKRFQSKHQSQHS